MEFTVSNHVIEWRGPAPFYLLPIPKAKSLEVKAVARDFTYGWGVLYVTLTKGSIKWITAVIPKDGEYMIPLKLEIRNKLAVEPGDKLTLKVKLGKYL